MLLGMNRSRGYLDERWARTIHGCAVLGDVTVELWNLPNAKLRERAFLEFSVCSSEEGFLQWWPHMALSVSVLSFDRSSSRYFSLFECPVIQFILYMAKKQQIEGILWVLGAVLVHVHGKGRSTNACVFSMFSYYFLFGLQYIKSWNSVYLLLHNSVNITSARCVN
jgi:hypothetical protein